MRNLMKEELKLQGTEVFQEEMGILKTPREKPDKSDNAGVLEL